MKPPEDSADKTASDGCSVSSCSASFLPNGDRILTADEKMEWALAAEKARWTMQTRMWVDSIEDIENGPVVLFMYADGTIEGMPKRAEVELSPAQRIRRGLLPSGEANPS